MRSVTTVGPRAHQTEADEAVRAMSDYLNHYGHSKDALVDAWSREHRTLQQSFTGVCLAWLKHLSEKNEGQYDLRNEASVVTARAIAQRMREEYGEGWDHLSFI